jgi:glycosyltransferase involved in cell wall biosynthesis
LKKSILFVNGHLNVGGVEKSLIDVLKSFDYNQYDVDLLLLEGLGDFANEIPKEVNVINYDLPSTYGPFLHCILSNIKNRNWFALCLRMVFMLDKVFGVKALALAKPIFQLNTHYECAIAYRVGIYSDFVAYAIHSKKKIVWWHNGQFDYPRKIVKRWTEVFKSFDKIVAVSESSKLMLLDHIPEIEHKTMTIANIINTNEINAMACEEPRVNFTTQECTTLVSVGRLSPEKAMINCVLTCKMLIDSGYNIKWFLIGEGIERERIERSIKEYKLENHIFLLGAISNPYPFIKKAHIYVHPSLVESLSLTVLEAIALKTPVTVARSMGPEEFIKHQDNGLLVEPTPEGLFSGIEVLLKDKSLYNTLKENNTEDVLKEYAPKVIMEKISELIEVC